MKVYEEAMALFHQQKFQRAKQELRRTAAAEIGERMLQGVQALERTRVVVRDRGRVTFLDEDEIDWIEAAGVYVTLHVGGKELLYRAALNDLAERLDPRRFVRVHRSALVNIESIIQLEPMSHGEFEAVIKNGSRARVSRTYRALLEKRLGQPL